MLPDRRLPYETTVLHRESIPMNISAGTKVLGESPVSGLPTDRKCQLSLGGWRPGVRLLRAGLGPSRSERPVGFRADTGNPGGEIIKPEGVFNNRTHTLSFIEGLSCQRRLDMSILENLNPDY